MRNEPTTRDCLPDLVRQPGAALLDGWSDSGRWTIALPDPVEELRVEWGDEERLECFLGDLRFRKTADDAGSRIPFLGGWVGFISYEVGSRWENAEPSGGTPPEPAALFYRHETGIAVSPDDVVMRIEGGRAVAATGLESVDSGREQPDGSCRGARSSLPLTASQRTLLHRRRERQKRVSSRATRPPDASAGSRVEDSLGAGSYERAHEAIREGIARGDYYQVNLTRRFSKVVSRRADPRCLFRELAGEDPPPYSALLLCGDFDVASASPELFLRADFVSRFTEMRPIKGTALRIADPAADRRSADGLRASEKDRAENVMIVDLCRNDLGRVCESGTVQVVDLCRLRSHRLHHLESTIAGRLRPGVGPREVLRATFPPGSVTGAPKRAAVGAIAGLEPVPRGVYTGAVGFFDDRGRVSLNVAIRTAVSSFGEVRYHAGGGITWDSKAEAESRESEWKATEFFAAAASLRGE